MSSKKKRSFKRKPANRPTPSANGQPPPEPAAGPDQPRDLGAAAALAGLAQSNYDLWHNDRGEAFATNRAGPPATYPVDGEEFRGLLRYLGYHESEGTKVPAAETLNAAVGLLTVIANHSGPPMPDSLRVAAYGEDNFLFLGDHEWRCVRFSGGGFEVIAKAPVRFRKTKTMGRLPDPLPGGGVEGMWRFLNAAHEDRVLVLAWAVQALLASGPYPVLALVADHGAGKSTFARVLQQLIDPNPAGLGSAPRTEQDVFIAATHNHLLAFDNLSKVPLWLSDALCKLATGGSHTSRKLYTNADQAVLAACRPVILTSIADVAEQPDLTSRCLFARLEPLGRGRKPEKKFWAEFAEGRANLLGALLDLACKALAILPQVPDLPADTRLPDFCRLGVAVDRAQGGDGSGFLTAFARNECEADAQTLEDSLVARPLLDLARTDGSWCGTATDLLGDLKRIAYPDGFPPRAWPSGPRALSGLIRGLAPVLRRQKVDVQFGRRDGTPTNHRLIDIKVIADDGDRFASEPSEPSEG